MTMGGVIDVKTKTEAQGYAPNWAKLEQRFPAIKDMLTYAEKWDHIQAQCNHANALTAKGHRDFVKANRPKMRNAHRVIVNKVVTDVFCADIVDNLIAEVAAFGDYKFHDSGIGVVAEAAADTALGTPWGGARTTGTQVEDSAKVYKSIAATTYNLTKAITEHGLFSIATAGILMDRTVFAAINVVSGNQIEWTFTIAFTSGG